MKTRMSLLLLLPVLVCVALVPSFAQTQAEMNEAAGREARKADGEMNKVYKELMGKLDEEGKGKLKASQRAWIRFRDADCDLAQDHFRGGSIMPMVRLQYYAETTRQRTLQLRTHLDDETKP